MNYLYRLPLGEPKSLSLWQPPGLETPAISVVSPEELASGKLVAFLDRVAPEMPITSAACPASTSSIGPGLDYDGLLAMSTVPPPSGPHVRPRTPFTPDGPAGSKRNWRRCSRSRKRPMRPRPDGALMVGGAAVSRALRKRERFIDLANRGELDPGLIADGDDAFAALVERHPAIRWKIENARHRRP